MLVKKKMRKEAFKPGAIAVYVPTGDLVRVHRDDVSSEVVRVVWESEPSWIVDCVMWWKLEPIAWRASAGVCSEAREVWDGSLDRGVK